MLYHACPGRGQLGDNMTVESVPGLDSPWSLQQSGPHSLFLNLVLSKKNEDKSPKHHSAPLGSLIRMRTKEHARVTLRDFCQRPSPHRSPRNGCAQIRCHVSGKQHCHHDSSHAVDGRSGPASCVRLLDCIIPPMAVLFGRVPFNLSAKRIAGMLNCILSDSVCCVFILFHQEFQALPLSHSSKMPPSPGPITTHPSSKRAVWEKGFPRHVWVACLVPWVPHRSRRPHSEMLTGHTEQELLTLSLPPYKLSTGRWKKNLPG